ncbi:hypothetical protein CC1G_13548 [Coprinopsis cinerea okayama7|uniref:Uncharacterized protein n=1 Tax=Coprinopsis cinerea (strain Okayama-7 / 130 / ATCC MYA-4618 / FGSC 9003) TaxID=240176 RepID=D6RJZ2_COPC7|nr:hypothetical protein CC1G_13548 [Coprinopsis cinerea okayama7\|eukprot:XP_002912020.1 hypothetical protein CC1G_13548 [Coprinopsis cinerea okayama7\
MSLQSLGRMITPENYTLDLLQTCLIHLHGIVVPASPEPTPPSFGDTMNRCGAALICLTDVLRVAMLLSEPLKEATVETLLREFDDFINATDGLLRWTNWESVYPQSFIPLARLQQALDTTCQVIAFLIKLDERLQSAVIASTKAIDIALRVWCWRDPYNPSRVHLSPFMTEYRMEETIGMICTYTMSFEGGQAILSALLASSNLRRTFVKAFFDRLSQLTEIANQNPERGGAVMTQLKFMAMIAGFLGQHITFYRMLEKRGRFLGKACGLASQICSRGFGLPIVPPTGASLFHAAFVMASDTVAAVITVLNSGILVWMLKGISAVPQAPSFSSVEAALDKLYGYAFHHRSLPALSHALKGVPASVSQAVKRIDKVGTLYTGLVMEVERNEILVGTLEPRVILCDNPADNS